MHTQTDTDTHTPTHTPTHTHIRCDKRFELCWLLKGTIMR